MKKLKIISAILVCVCLSAAAQKTVVSGTDLKMLTGGWEGMLTYMDYSSAKPYTMPANVEIVRKSDNLFILSNIYPDEPKANSTDSLSISTDGKMLNNHTITSFKKSKNGDSEIVTEYSGTDGNDNKPAAIRIIYSFDKKHFSIRKDVKFGKADWIVRHTFDYKKTGKP